MSASEISIEGVETSRKIIKSTQEANVVNIEFSDGLKGQLTFLEDTIFRWHLDPEGLFPQYAIPNSEDHKGLIQTQCDCSDYYSKPVPVVIEHDGKLLITVHNTQISFNQETSLMSVEKDGEIVMKETSPIEIGSVSKQTLSHDVHEYFFGGGMQNGRFTHKGEVINIVNESSWVDGGVTSPNPFYWSTKGYGVLRNTFKPGKYDFGKVQVSAIETQHDEKRFDAYYFLGDTPTKLLQAYYKVTGNPVLLPEYAYYLGHLNAYNRDGWSTDDQGGGKEWKLEDGKTYFEHGRNPKYKLPVDDTGKIPLESSIIPETLNGESPLSDRSYEELYKFSARAVIDSHGEHDMPLGYFLPNDGYGAGYGQHGYYENYPLGSNENLKDRAKAVKSNIENLAKFTQYANDRGVQTGLWAQSALTPDTSEKDTFGYAGYQTLRDFNNEVLEGGVRTLKTDVAWVGPGYSMALDSTATVYKGIGQTKTRPNIISLDGWAGTQRHAAIWSGDQTGGDWEYIRFHIPTYIGQSLAGNPNVGSDIDGIFGGNALITTRDIQWKIFTPLMLDMDGWGAIPKKPYGHSANHDDINRMYLKLKAELMPYLYTTAYQAIDGLPMIRAMFLEYPKEARGYTKLVQYQFMYGSQFLIAPVYQDTQSDEEGNDIRNNIFLPGDDDIWIDYFSGKAYRGGQTINGFEAPLWKLPLFIKDGSIIPMYEENNNPQTISASNPMGLDKSKRVVEFYPSEKASAYTGIEDDGMTTDALDHEGHEKSVVTYGDKVETNYSSQIVHGTAYLSITRSTGNYDGYNANKSTHVIVNMTDKPSSLKVQTNGVAISLVEAKSLEDFNVLKAEDKNVSFYDETPNMNKYSQGGGTFESLEILSNPKLYIAISAHNALTTDINIELENYIHDFKFGKDQINANLQTPVFGANQTTSSSIKLVWNPIEDAANYDIMVNGEVQGGFPGYQNSFIHDDLAYSSNYTYQIRARNLEGYSTWSPEITVETDLDPWRNVPVGTIHSTVVDYHYTYGIGFAFDQKFDTSVFRSSLDLDLVENKDIVIEYDKIYTFDEMAYHLSPNYLERFAKRMTIAVSYDGVHYEEVLSSTEREFSSADFIDSIKGHPHATIALNNARGKFLKITPTELNDKVGCLAASEIVVYQVDKSQSYPLGDFNMDGKVDDNDLTQINAYKGLIAGETQFETQVKANNSDINRNGVFDIYDYSFVLNQLEGGTKQTGEPTGTLYVEQSPLVEAFQTFKVSGVNLQNINACGGIIKYNSHEFEVVSISKLDGVKDMLDLSVKASGFDENKVATISFGNVGEKEMIHGTTDLFEIKVKSLQGKIFKLPKSMMLIGPENQLLNADLIDSNDKTDNKGN